MKTTSTNLLILGALVVAGGAYWYFFTGTTEEPTITTSAIDNQAQTQFQLLVNSLPLSFESSIFEDKRFKSLIDISTEVTPESTGRTDPFAPLGSAPLDSATL